MKYIIEITEVETLPNDWTKCQSWPGKGFYKVKTEDNIYHIGPWSVDFLGSSSDEIMNTPYVSPGEAITESLLLKVVAAASRPDLVLKNDQ